MPLRDAIERWFALRLACRSWASVLEEVGPALARALPACLPARLCRRPAPPSAHRCPQGPPLPALEIWAASPACLAWLTRVGVRGATFRRRAPLHLDDPSASASSASSSDADAPSADEAAPAAAGSQAQQQERFRPSSRRADWRRRRSAGIPSVAEWPSSAYNEMLWSLNGVVCGRQHEQLLRAADNGWCLSTWTRLEALSLQAPGGGRPAAFRAPAALAGLPRLHRLELSGALRPARLARSAGLALQCLPDDASAARQLLLARCTAPLPHAGRSSRSKAPHPPAARRPPGFGDYELKALPPSLRVLRLMQRQATAEGPVQPVQLGPMLGDSLKCEPWGVAAHAGGTCVRAWLLAACQVVGARSASALQSCLSPLPCRLDELRFELLPPPLEQLQRQGWQQAEVDPHLHSLRRRCRRLVVQAPGRILLCCACPRCTAALEGGGDDASMSEGDAAGPAGTSEWRPPPADPTAWLAEALGRLAALLAAPGSLLCSLDLRSQLPRLEPDGDPDDAACAMGEAACGVRTRPEAAAAHLLFACTTHALSLQDCLCAVLTQGPCRPARRAGLELWRCTRARGVYECRGLLHAERLQAAAQAAAAAASADQGMRAQQAPAAPAVEETAGSWVGGLRSIPSGLRLRRLPPGAPPPPRGAEAC